MIFINNKGDVAVILILITDSAHDYVDGILFPKYFVDNVTFSLSHNKIYIQPLIL